MAIEIVDFPINSMVIFHCYVSSPEGKPFIYRGFLQLGTIISPLNPCRWNGAVEIGISLLAVNGVSHNDHLGRHKDPARKADIDDIISAFFWWYVPKKNRTPDTSQKCTKKRTNLYFKTFKTLLNMLYLCIPCESLSSHTHWASPDEDSPIHGLKFGERCQVPLGVTGTLWTLRKVQLMRSGLAL